MFCDENSLLEIKKASFRDIERNYVYIKCPDWLKTQTDILEISEKDDGIFGLGYVDHEAGLTIRIISCAHIENNQLITGKENKEVMSMIRVEAIENELFYPISVEEIDLKKYGHYVEETMHYYESCEEAVKVRSIEVLDEFRHQFYPDDIEIHFVGKKIEPENMWLRITKLKDKSFYGTLLDEPVQKIGIHIGDVISFNIHQFEDGSLHALHVCN